MKKYLSFLSIIGVTLFSACSSGDDLAVQEMTQEEKEAAIIAEANMASDVQIRLGFGSQSNGMSITRAPLESDANGVFSTPTGVNAKYLGIYCLAQKPQTPTASPGPVLESEISWIDPLATNLTYLMNRNQAARVVVVPQGGKIGNVTLTQAASDVQFMTNDLSGQQYYYYPYGNWYNYYFYAYYPRQVDTGVAETTPIHEASNKVTVDFTLDGTQDIIWAKAMPDIENPTAAINDEGFNAKYLRGRQNPTGTNSLEDLPNLGLGHKLAQVRFYVQCKSPNYVAYNYAEDIGSHGSYRKLFQLKELKLTLVPKKWNLTVADRMTPANEGKLVFNGTIDANNKVDEASSTTDIHVKAMTVDPATGAVLTSSDNNALNGTDGVNIPFTGAEVTYWKIAPKTGGGYEWASATADEFTNAGANGIPLATNVGLDNANLTEANYTAGKVYKVFYDADRDGVEDATPASPLLVGYAMIPTTEMMTGLTIDNRGDQSRNPYISFTLLTGQTKDNTTDADIAGSEWTSASQCITIPTAGLEAGKVYNIILDIPVPEEVDMTATLNGWQVVPVSDETTTGQNINMTVD